jgi:hypothetical protein
MSELYVRLADGYELKGDGMKIVGTEVYRRNDNSNHGVDFGHMPVVNSTLMQDPNGNAVTGCMCRGVTVRYAGGDPTIPEYVFNFSTHDPAQQSTGNQFVVGTDNIVIDKPSGWKWKTADTDIDIPLFIQVATGTLSYRVSKKNSEIEDYRTTIADIAGTVNSDPFKGYNEGNVYFAGASGSSAITTDPSTGFTIKFWYIDLHFSIKQIPDVDKDGWNSLMRPDGVWDIPIQGDDEEAKLYDKTDFRSLGDLTDSFYSQ